MKVYNIRLSPQPKIFIFTIDGKQNLKTVENNAAHKFQYYLLFFLSSTEREHDICLI